MKLMSRRFKHKYRIIQPWVIWGLGASFFFSEYFARVDPSIIAKSLMAYFHIGAFELGALSACFYYPYIIMQIPVGSLMDRYGPHRLLTGAALICGLGCFLFANSSSLGMAEVARGLMGFSAAFAFVGAVKIATLWFEPQRLGLLAGLTQGMGMLGAAFGEGFFAILVKHIGWRDTLMLIGAILVLIGVLIGLIVRDRKPTLLRHYTKPEDNQVSTLEGLRIVFRNKFTWLNALYVGLVYAPTAVFAELWGPLYLQHHYGFNNVQSSIAVSMVFLGWAVGGPSIGFLSDVVRKRKPLMYASALFSLVFLSMALFLPYGTKIPLSLLCLIFFLYGISNTGVAISYAYSSEINPLPVAGLSVAFANMMSIGVGAVLQEVVGAILGLDWRGAIVHGVRVYPQGSYSHALLLLPVCLVLAFLLVFFIKETHCQRR